MTEKIPSLLLPAGSPAALDAALSAGADEIYFGGKGFNARAGADNFTLEQIADAVIKCHFFGVRANVTLNTAVYDKEYGEMLAFVEQLYRNDVDALIVADLGAAKKIKERFPNLRLHASTQCAGHNAEAATVLKELGFDRMVLARECSFGDIVMTKRAQPDIEYEIFVHGAHCVCHSGMCEYSACMGGRSGNRGECAQPCRLPDKEGKHRLSLKDMCLAEYIPQIIDSGVSSLKVEGRMKSPQYVYTVGKIYRRLLDEKRGADKDELIMLDRIFSRGGFTDGYFTHKIGVGMLGTRTDADKEKTADAEKTAAFAMKSDTRKLPIRMSAEFYANRACRLQVSCDTVQGQASATVYGATPEPAVTSSLTKESIIKNLTKLGATPFCASADDVSLIMDEGISLPVSAVNSLRRTAVEKLLASVSTVKYPHRADHRSEAVETKKELEPKHCGSSAHFTHASAIPPRIYLGMFEHIFLPIEEYLKADDEIRSMTDGVEFPPVVTQHEYKELEDMVLSAKMAGARCAYINNIGTLSLAKKYGLVPHGGMGLNVFSAATAEVLADMGFASVTVSAELRTPQISAIARTADIQTGCAVYGKIPVMVVEKCVIRDIAMDWHSPSIEDCSFCDGVPYTYLTDRRGAKLPIRRAWGHRNVIYNSVPIYMGDKPDLITSELVGERRFFFTDETSTEVASVIEKYRFGKKTDGDMRRL